MPTDWGIMSDIAVTADGLWKNFRLYQERNQFLKAAILRGRRVRYEEFWALKDVSLEVPTGTTFGVIGHNGSGKSTLLKTLTGILVPDQGSVKTVGRVSALLELGAGFHPELSGRENVFLNGAILGLKRKEIEKRFDDIVEFAGLEQFIDSPVKNYSSGMFVRLGFAVAANVEPDVLLIDEVLSVGDENFARKSAEKIDQFRRDGRTIVFVSHGLDSVEQLCETVAWLDHGEIQMIGPAAEVISAYRGDRHDAVTTPEEFGSRWGSGEIQISSVEIFDGEGQPVEHPRTLDPMTIRVNVTAHAPIQDSVLVAKIDQLGGHTVWQSSTRRNGVSVGLIKDAATIELKFPALPLLEGTYEFTLALTDQAEVQPYDWWERRIRFDVRQYVSGDHGVIHIPTTWTVEGASDIVQMG
jgi:ABC-type polysaccharide/polyol phosphate transport system ATPase subunit